MKTAFGSVAAGLIAVAASYPALASDDGHDWPDLIGPALVVQDLSEVADIRMALARTSETVPALFRLTLSRANNEISSFKRDAQAEFEELGDNPEYPWRQWSYDIVFEERYAREPLYSLLENKFTFTGGAHPNTDFGVVNFDTRTGHEFGLYDLFDDVAEESPVLTAMAAYAREDLAAQKSERFGEMIPEDDESLDAVTPTAELFRLFTLTPARDAPGAAGVTIHFPPYAVGAYVEGSYDVFIPAEVFAEYLTADFANYFGGAPVDLEPVTNWEYPGALLLSASPRNDEKVSSPLAVSGEAPSHWFFEGVANVEVLDEDGSSLGTGYVTWDPATPTSGVATGMAAYAGTVEFADPSSGTGIVVVSEDDPSDGEGGPVERVSIYVEFE